MKYKEDSEGKVKSKCHYMPSLSSKFSRISEGKRFKSAKPTTGTPS